MNPDDYLNSLALRSGKLFGDLPETEHDCNAFACDGCRSGASMNDTLHNCENSISLPREHYGYRGTVLRYKPLAYRSRYDARAVVSLAAFDKEAPVVIDYANKLPIICLNVRRFAYTVEAFRFKRYRCVSGSAALSDPQFLSGSGDSIWAPGVDEKPGEQNRGPETDQIARDALQFMISVDISRVSSWCDEMYANTGQRPGANERFSRLLHLTRCTGYEEYLFALARMLGTHVDLIKCRGQPADPIDGKPLLRQNFTIRNDRREDCYGHDPTFDEAVDTDPSSAADEGGVRLKNCRKYNDCANDDAFVDETSLGCSVTPWKRRAAALSSVDSQTVSRATNGVPPSDSEVNESGSRQQYGTKAGDINSAVAALNETVLFDLPSQKRPRFFVRYVRTKRENSTASDGEKRLSRVPRAYALNDPSNGNGVLTAIVDGNQWHVRATRTPIVRLLD